MTDDVRKEERREGRREDSRMDGWEPQAVQNSSWHLRPTKMGRKILIIWLKSKVHIDRVKC